MRRAHLFFSLGLVLLSLPLPAAEVPFGIHIMDEATHRGVPMALLETTDHARYVSDSAGWVAFAEPGLLRRRVHFALSCPGYTFAKDATGAAGIALDTVPGGSAEIIAMRTDIAERMYRITGLGIYRDSTLLGYEAALPRPNINAGVLCQGQVQAALHGGRLFWAWAETLLATQSLGLRQSVGGYSELPSGKGLDPSQGIHIDYFLNAQQEPAGLVPSEEAGGIALEGVVSVNDALGVEHLVAHYTRRQADTKPLEHGLVELNTEHSFDRLIVLGDDYAWQFPQGHAVSVVEGSATYLYFATPLCHTRCPATYESVMNPASYEALAFDSASKTLLWQKAHAPLTQALEKKLIAAKSLPASAARGQLTDVISRQSIVLHSGSVQWNAFRKRWIMLASASLASSDAGDVWYAEAAAVSGPWGKVLRIVSHGAARFEAPCHHAFFDQKNGQLIYFEGGFASAVGGDRVPRYDRNQLMYRLDLADERLKVLGE